MSPEEATAQAKERFYRAMSDLEPLSAVRNHPFVSLGCALALGAGLPALLRRGVLPALMPLFVEAGVELAKTILADNRRP